MSELADNLGPFADAIPVIATTICVVTVYDSKHRGNSILAFALAVWFALAVVLAKQDAFLISPTTWSGPEDFAGFVTFASLPIVPLLNFSILYRAIPQLQDYFLEEVPAWGMIGLQLYRVAGGCFLYVYLNGSMPNYVALQTGVLDLFIGLTAIPLAILVKRRGLRNVSALVLVWNAIGLFDLVSTFAFFFASYFGFYETEPALSIFGFYPFSLIVLFQMPLAMGIHILFLTQLQFMMPEEQQHKDD
jgi:hypothetical protein